MSSIKSRWRLRLRANTRRHLISKLYIYSYGVYDSISRSLPRGCEINVSYAMFGYTYGHSVNGKKYREDTRILFSKSNIMQRRKTSFSMTKKRHCNFFCRKTYMYPFKTNILLAKISLCYFICKFLSSGIYIYIYLFDLYLESSRKFWIFVERSVFETKIFYWTYMSAYFK